MQQEEIEDLISQKTLLREMNLDLKKRLENLKTNTIHLEQNISDKEKVIKELREDKKILTELLRGPNKNKILQKVTIVAALGLAVFIFISYISSDLQSFNAANNIPFKTQYLIQNLKSNTNYLWKPWHLVNNQALNVNIVNADMVSKEKMDAIKYAILSEESVKIDNSLLDRGPVGTVSTYYKGWQGAIENIPNKKTEFNIPTKFNIIESPTEEGDIRIILSNLENPDDYSGYTKDFTDGKEIYQATITIYNVDHLSPQQLGTIIRHEFGHALGLGHSTNQNDLMHPTIDTVYPFVSDCDADAVKDLYDGKKINDISCVSQKST